MMSSQRIISTRALISPAVLKQELPCSPALTHFILQTRRKISQIMHGQDPRRLVVVGPCSIHDPEAALEYAHHLKIAREQLGSSLEIVMRIYFEKPRTSMGWKGLIHDPKLDQSHDVNFGIRTARQLLVDINSLGVPAATEFLDTSVPQFLSDLISWGAIGARTTESQIHRQLASGLPMPIGFKNGTHGNIQVAINAIIAAQQQQQFIGIDDHGISTIFTTSGNLDGHLVLRGSSDATNYDETHIQETVKQLMAHHLSPFLMVDCSHGNSQKNYLQQIKVIDNIIQQSSHTLSAIKGIMLESHLVAGAQEFASGKPLIYGQSITDPCLSWDQTWPLLEMLAETTENSTLV